MLGAQTQSELTDRVGRCQPCYHPRLVATVYIYRDANLNYNSHNKAPPRPNIPIRSSKAWSNIKLDSPVSLQHFSHLLNHKTRSPDLASTSNCSHSKMPYLALIKKVRTNSWICSFTRICTKISRSVFGTETHPPSKFWANTFSRFFCNPSDKPTNGHGWEHNLDGGG